MVAFGQFALRVEADLVDDAGEDDDAAGQDARAADGKAHGDGGRLIDSNV